MSPRHIVLAPEALRELDAIFDHTTLVFGLKQAEAYALKLHMHIAALAEQPGIGRAMGQPRMGLKIFPAEKHRIVYRVLRERLEVVAFLHQAMDVPSRIKILARRI